MEKDWLVGMNIVPISSTVKKIIEKFENTESVVQIKPTI